MIAFQDVVVRILRLIMIKARQPALRKIINNLERRELRDEPCDVIWQLSPEESLPQPAIQVEGFHNAMLLVHSGAVMRNGYIIRTFLDQGADVGKVEHRHSRAAKPIQLTGAVASIEMIWSANFYHRLVDGLYALYALRAIPPEVPLTLVTWMKLPPVLEQAYREWLPERPLLQLNRTDRVVAPLVANLSRIKPVPFQGRMVFEIPSLPHPIRAFTRAYGVGCDLPEPLRKARRLYLGRGDAQQRRLLNEAEVETLLAARGFQSVLLQNLTNAQQFELFRNAEAIVAVRGATVANLLAIQSPIRWLSIRPTADRDGHQILQSFIDNGELEYNEVAGNGVHRNADFSVNLSDLALALDRLML